MYLKKCHVARSTRFHTKCTCFSKIKRFFILYNSIIKILRKVITSWINNNFQVHSLEIDTFCFALRIQERKRRASLKTVQPRSGGKIALLPEFRRGTDLHSTRRKIWSCRTRLYSRSEDRAIRSGLRRADRGGRRRRTAGSQLVAYNERAKSVGSLIAIFTASSNYWVNMKNPRVNISFEKKREN